MKSIITAFSLSCLGGLTFAHAQEPLPGEKRHTTPGEMTISERMLNYSGLLGSTGERGLYVSVTCKRGAVHELNAFSVQDDLYAVIHESPSGVTPGRQADELIYHFYQNHAGKLVPLFTPEKHQEFLDALADGAADIDRSGKLNTDGVYRSAKAVCQPSIS